jgi:hypothetical protein
MEGQLGYSDGWTARIKRCRAALAVHPSSPFTPIPHSTPMQSGRIQISVSTLPPFLTQRSPRHPRPNPSITHTHTEYSRTQHTHKSSNVPTANEVPFLASILPITQHKSGIQGASPCCIFCTLCKLCSLAPQKRD